MNHNAVEKFILQWNVRSLMGAPHWAEFKNYVLKDKPLIAAVQETFFRDSDRINYTYRISGYTLYTKNRYDDEERGGGAALFISNNILHHQIYINNVNPDIEYVAAKINLAQLEFVIVSLYLRPQTNFNNDITDLFNNVPRPCIILGDMNAHSPTWGCALQDNRGRHIENLLHQNNLVFLNDQTHTYLPANVRNRSSAVDLSLVSPRLSTKFSWQVQCDTYFSDHYPIHIKFETDPGANDFFLPKWNLSRGAWVPFGEDLDTTHPPASSPNITDFLNTMLVSAQKHIPLTRRPPGCKRAPWWNNDCARAVAMRRRTEKKFRRNLTNENEIAAREAKINCANVILNAKKASWESFSNQFNRFTSTSKIWKLVKLFSNGKNVAWNFPQLSINDIDYSLPADVVQQFAQHYANISSANQYPPNSVAHLRIALAACNFNSDNQEPYNLPFTLYELKLAISKSGNTSVGPDQIAYAFFRNLSEQSLENLLAAYNNMWLTDSFPETWSSSIIIPILKLGKPPSDPASYRPISLTSCACKIFERMINGRLRVYLDKHESLTTFQNGFRTRRSTIDSIIQLVDSIQRGFSKRPSEVTVALFLDLKAAFDTVHSSAVLAQLHKFGLRGRLTKFISNFMQNRSFSVRCGNTYSPQMAMDEGLPQGSVLSPTLFLIAINDVTKTLAENHRHLRYSIYADDIVIWATRSSTDLASRIVQRGLDHISSWCSLRGLKISQNKSVTVVFSKNNCHVVPTYPLTTNGLDILLEK